jgi:hypothetical protein
MRLCIICKSEIEGERIEAIPATRLCALHGREIQRFGGEFTVTASQERTSKQGSLKLNYGAVTTSSKRNDEALEKLRLEFEEQHRPE